MPNESTRDCGICGKTLELTAPDDAPNDDPYAVEGGHYVESQGVGEFWCNECVDAGPLGRAERWVR